MRWSRTTRGSGCVLAVAALTSCSALSGGPDSGLRDGPLRGTTPHAWAIDREVDDVFTDGLESLIFEGSSDAELVEVRMVGDNDLELIGVALGSPDRRFGSTQLMDGFPPRDPTLTDDAIIEDALGHPMTAHTRADIGWELLLGIRATEPGRHVRTGIEVTYTVGGERYVELIPAALAVCAHAAGVSPEGDCELPAIPR